jgi:hypothetical protein
LTKTTTAKCDACGEEAKVSSSRPGLGNTYSNVVGIDVVTPAFRRPRQGLVRVTMELPVEGANSGNIWPLMDLCKSCICKVLDQVKVSYQGA